MLLKDACRCKAAQRCLTGGCASIPRPLLLLQLLLLMLLLLHFLPFLLPLPLAALLLRAVSGCRLPHPAVWQGRHMLHMG